MKIKRLLAMVLAVAMLVSGLSLSAFAEETKETKTYNYVAFGDSIASGYGLSEVGESGIDPALILSEELIANPVAEAYPAVFGEYLAALGAEAGYTTTTANLSSTAYRAEDIANTILNAGVKGEVAAFILENFVGQGSSAALEPYHDIYMNHLPEADLVSIGLGANDIIMGIVYPMIQSGNPVLIASAVSVALVLFGGDTTTAIGGGLQVLMTYKDQITAESFTEAAAYFKTVISNGTLYVDNAANNVKSVLDAVRTVNSDADIAVLGMFNPFGNSLEYDGKVRDVCTVVTGIFCRAAAEIAGGSEDDEIAPTEEIDLIAEEEVDDKTEEFLAYLEQLQEAVSAFGSTKVGAKLSSLVSIVTEEISYPLQYLLIGKNADSQIKLLNVELEAIAESNGCEFVDIYDIDNECNLDPHPMTQGHKQIADHMYKQLSGLVNYRMTGVKPAGSKSYTIQKISNPENGERQVDGLIEGGDRENSYTWRLAMRGDDIYVATTRNIASALVNMYGGAFAEAGISIDTFWALIDVVTNGDIPRNDANEGANIIRYNRTTGKFDVIYTADTGDYFRMAVTYGDNVYFGSYSAVPTNPQYILKLDTEGNFTKVFETMGSVSLRANCVYDDGESENLYFAGADDRTPVENGDTPVAKMAVLRKSNDDDTVWDRVADYRDFGTTSYDPIHESWAGAPIWELANHNGYIYATAPTHNGFVIYKGHPAADGETANEYGWYWEEVAGLTNGINNPGLSDVEGGEPGTMRSLIGSVYEFNGELYAYNFDHSFGGEASAFAGMLQQIAGKDVKASEYLFYLYDSLHNPQKVWKLDDETGKFEELTAFTELMEGTTNEYVWRLGSYDGDLYVATMDAGIFYNYLTQLTNGSFFSMSCDEIKEKIGYINALIKLIAASKGSEVLDELKAKLVELKAFLEAFEAGNPIDEKIAIYLGDIAELVVSIKIIAQQLEDTLENEQADAVADAIVDNDEGLVPTGAYADIDETGLTFIIIDAQTMAALKAQAEELMKYIDAQQVKEIIATQLKALYEKYFSGLYAKFEEIYNSIDVEGIKMYLYINEAVKNDEWGFDLLRTSDGGKSFEVITRNGFDDKYNYGCPSFLETEEGLYIGTCNPFYGGQLYLLTNDKTPTESYTVGDVNGDGEVTNRDSIILERYIAGWDGYADYIVNPDAADLNRDGEITNRDVMILDRYVAGWEGYDKYIITVTA